ncbi:right-handed parallel beta-helix repeat-containing protein [uncultured Eudoraea sp.]|uniref:right-handed parallel beta-helix repeat-containing protein n=1 Tax=uncultured Eudoraea sp. TaxID=1035614 RepID=UPI0026230BD9|nr:right-handed parallel beta-helix repeat-containing protein [uncultured Eudoraea sp.]
MKRLLIPLLAILLIASCSEEEITLENESQLNQEKIAWLKAVDSYKADYERQLNNIKKESDLIKRNTALAFLRLTETKAERVSFRKNQLDNLSFVNKKSLIKVPEDYASLQEAVDNAEPNGEIQIIGNLENQGEVFVDVQGIKIKGADNSSISGTAINLLAEDIEVSNLDLQIKLVIGSGANGAKVLNNKLKSLSTETDALILMNNVSGCTIKDNTISDEGNTLISGISAQDCSDNEFKSNTIYGGINTFAHLLFNNSTNNEIKDCHIENGGNIDGAGVLFEGNNNDNIIKGCNIQNVGGDGVTFIGGSFENRGKNNQILNCTVKNYNGGWFSRGLVMVHVEASVIRNCEVNNKDADGSENVFSEGINLVNATDCKIDNCIVEYNNGGGIALVFNLRGTNSLINCKVNNNGGALIKSQLGCFGVTTIPQAVNGSIIIDNCVVSNNIAVGDPLPYPFYIRAAIAVGYSYYGPSNSFSHIVSNCKANNNKGTVAGGIVAAAFSDFFGQNPNVTFNLYNNVANGNKNGIGLSGLENAILTNNTARGNSICDFVEDDLTGPVIGTVLTNNNFGTTCVVNN